MTFKRQPKFIFFTGGVISSLGKGLSAAATGTLMEGRALLVTTVKLDPYIHVDPAPMNPLHPGAHTVPDHRPDAFAKARCRTPASRLSGWRRAWLRSTPGLAMPAHS